MLLLRRAGVSLLSLSLLQYWSTNLCPAARLEKPSSKALLEHLAKLKRSASAFASGGVSTPVSAAKSTSKSTPRNTGKKAVTTPASKKRTANRVDSADEESYSTPPAAKKQARAPRSSAKAARKIIEKVANAEDSNHSSVSEGPDSGSDFSPPTPGEPVCEPADETAEKIIKKEIVDEVAADDQMGQDDSIFKSTDCETNLNAIDTSSSFTAINSGFNFSSE